MNKELIEGVAIIGVAGRFPGADDVVQYWENLKGGIESISVLTDEELIAAGVTADIFSQKNYVRTKGVIKDSTEFDAAFFGFNPREAEILDPQHRLFLEESWHALEDAGYDPAKVDERIGMYAGCGTTTYLFQLYGNPDVMRDSGGMAVLISNDKDYITTRTSYKLNLRGPSVNVQSACSTSLVAIAMAANSLINYECDMALAGGVSIRTPELTGFQYMEGGILSPDGHCRAFDERGQGTVFSSGLGVVVLKRLSEAVADRDHIYAVILGNAVNNDGQVKIGFTAPSVEGQAEAAAEAIGMAGINPESIGYVEAHGTATQLGDPIEVTALTKVFRDHTEKKNFCALGSVKTNIGHTDIAAGVAGLIKAALSLKHKTLVPSLHFKTPNPGLNLNDSPFFVNTNLVAWPRAEGGRLRAAVSSFGVGGTNASVILEEAPEQEPPTNSRDWQLLLLSAKSETSLEMANTRMARFLKQEAALPFADVAYTTKIGRRAFDYRRAIICRDRQDAIMALQDGEGEVIDGEAPGAIAAPLTFMFSGQGSQYVDMAKGLYVAEPVFRETLERCAALLEPHLGLDLLTLIYPAEEDFESAAQRLKQTAFTQPALFSIEYATAQLLISWGMAPESMIGHSVGEYVAACLAGVFSLEDALALIALRGRLMNELPGGAMLAIMLPENRVLTLLDPQISVAAVNGPSVTVVSGPFGAIAALEDTLKQSAIMFSVLLTSHAFHSPMMDPILDLFDQAVAKLTLNTPAIPYISNVTGTWITADDLADPTYWSRHLRGAVRFADGFAKLLEDPNRIFLEVGPGQALQSVCKSASLEAASRTILGTIRPPKSPEQDTAVITRTLGAAWAHGAQIGWDAYYGEEARYRVSMPGYAFERERYYIEPAERSSSIQDGSSGALRRQADLADWFYIPTWKGTPNATLLAKAETAAAAVPWLVFVDELGLGESIVAMLRKQGRRAITVEAGAGFAQVGADGFVIDPDDKEHYPRLFKELRRNGTEPGRIIHLWNFIGKQVGLDLTTLALAENRAFYAPLYLGQALAEQKAPARLLFVSNQMHYMIGDESGSPAQALLVGPSRLITKECAQVHCRSVDLNILQPGPIDKALAHQLIAEAAVESDDIVVAYRGGARWVEDLRTAHVGPQSSTPRLDPLLRDGGTYLITGGLGGVGLVVAQYLARQVGARLVLTGRTEIPKRQAWETFLAEHHDSDATCQRLRGLLEVEAAGGEILVLQGDVADLSDMRRIVETAEAKFGHIDGVFHVAGVPGGGLIQLKTRDDAERVLRSKVRGTLVLEEVFADRALDFTILFSSVSASLAATGQVDYTAANAFLDSYAVHARALGRNILSIGWDTWAEVGMGVGYDQRINGELQQAETIGRIDHGLLQWRRDRGVEETYSLELDGEQHWALGDHRVVGRATLVGTAYIDMAVSAVQTRSPGKAVELTNLYLLAPMTIEPGERKSVELQFSGEGERRDLRFRSRARRYGEETAWDDHVVGAVRQVDNSDTPVRSISDLTYRLPLQPAAIAAIKDSDNIIFGPRWNNLLSFGLGQNEALALLELPETFSSELEAYSLHPALLDMATAFAVRYATDGFFLPISYRRLLVRSQLPQRIFSHVRWTEGDSTAREIISLDVALLDEQGNELVMIEGYALKRVPEDFTARASAAVATDHHHGEQGILTTEGVEALRRIMENDMPARVLVSRFDMAQRIERSHIRREHGVDVSNLAKRSSRHKRPKIKTIYVAPRNELEEQVAEVWQAILGIEGVGVDDGFIELGGNSLLAVQVISRLRDAFEIELPLEVLYDAPTVAGIAECVLTAMVGDADSDELAKLLEEMEAGAA